jgi:predicted RND superfamily exporter protein
MKSGCCITLFLSLFLLACSSNDDENSNSDKEFYSVIAFIRSELDMLDSIPLAVFTYREEWGLRDTQIISKQSFRQSAEGYFNPDISQTDLKGKYTEKVFMDANINRITLSYDTDDESAAIRKINVLIEPESEKVKNIYLEKRLVSGDTIFTQKMIWSSGRQLQVTTIPNIKGVSGAIVKIAYVWDTAN